MQLNLISATTLANSVQSTVYLFKKIWKQHTTALLHAPRAVDKTPPALDIVEEITRRSEKVIYVDTQNHLLAYHRRISANDKLFILNPRYDSPDDTTDYADLVINSIEEAIRTTDIKIFVVDSVTRIAALSFGRNASAAYVMKRLVALQVRHGISLLVISHDSTRATDRALSNLADSEILVDSAPANSVEAPFIAQPITTNRRDSDSRTPGPDLPTHAPKMTRQQRRALEREAAKLARKAAF